MANSVTVDCGEVLDISMAANLYEQLKVVKAGDSVTFNDADLSRIDASCLQVMVAFSRFAENNQVSVHWKPGTDTAKSAAQLLGIKEFIKFS